MSSCGYNGCYIFLLRIIVACISGNPKHLMKEHVAWAENDHLIQIVDIFAQIYRHRDHFMSEYFALFQTNVFKYIKSA